MKPRLFALTFMMFGSTVHAADMVREAPQPPAAPAATPAFDWSGPYLGLQGGGVWSRADYYNGSLVRNFNGGRFGAFGGYQHQFDNNIVLGLEGDVSYNWDKRFITATDYHGTGWNGSIRGRAGYAFDNLLVYATGGWAITNEFIGRASTATEVSRTFNGYTIGAGVDYAFTNNLFGRVEYRFSDYGKETFNSSTLGVVPTKLQQNSLVVGIAYKF